MAHEIDRDVSDEPVRDPTPPARAASWRRWFTDDADADRTAWGAPFSPRGESTAWWLAALAVMALALAVRLWAMRWEPFRIDMGTFIAWAERMRTGGPRNFYAEGVFADYAPGYLYVLDWTARVKQWFFADSGQSTWYWLIRLPPILADVAVTFLIFLIVERTWRGERRDEDRSRFPTVATVAAASYALNPAIIWNSAVWGQVDATFTLAMLVSLMLLVRGRPVGAVAVYVVAFLIKPQAAAIAPVLITVLAVRYPPRRWLVAGAVGLGLMFLLLVPFFGLGSFVDLARRLRGSTDTYAYTSLFSYNLWGIYDFWKPDDAKLFGGLSVRAAGSLLFLLGLGYGIVLLVQELRRTADLTFTTFLFATYFAFMPVMVLTRMHERYLYPVLPFMLIFAMLCQRRSELLDAADDAHPTAAPTFLSVPLTLYIGLTVLHTMNLYQVYEYYQNYDRGGPPLTNTLFYRIADNAKVWAVLTLFAFTSFMVLLPSWLRSDRPGLADERPRGPHERPSAATA